MEHDGTHSMNTQQVKTVVLLGVPIVALVIDGQERLCLAQISSTLLRQFSYNEIHNRRVALGITCLQCTPVQLEILRRARAMPVSSRRCGMITRREAERLCKSFLSDKKPPQLPEDFAFKVEHKCGWGCRGRFTPSRYTSSRAKCVQCEQCHLFCSPNKFIFHSHRQPNASYVQPDAANFNAWRRHLLLCESDQNEDLLHAWEDVKAMFNGGSRKRLASSPANNVKQMVAKRLRPASPLLPETNAVERGVKSPISCNRGQTAPSAIDQQQTLLNPFGMPPPSFWPYPSPILPSSFFLSQPSLFNPGLYTAGLKPTYESAPPLENNGINEENTNGSEEKIESETVEQLPDDKTKVEEKKELSKYTSLSKEQLQELLINEIEARKKLEQDLQILKEAFLKQLDQKQEHNALHQ